MRALGNALIVVCAILAAGFVVAVYESLRAVGAQLVAFGAALGPVVIAAGWVTVGGVALYAGVFAWWWVARTRHEHNRQRDGAFAVREYWLDGWLRRALNGLLGRVSARALVDINTLITHGALIDQFGVHPLKPAGGDMAAQLEYSKFVEGTRRAEAVMPGDMVVGNPLVSLARGTTGVANAPTGRFLAGAYDRQPSPGRTVDQPQPDVPQLPPPAPLSVRDGFNNNTDRQLVLGQTPEGRPVFWNMTDTPHLRFHGKTQGSGKTNAIQTVAAGAARSGAHVVVLDRRSFKDWTEFRGIAELVDTRDPRRFVAAVTVLRDVYQDRDRLLGEAGAPNIASLPNPPRRVVVIVTEFGALCEVADGEGLLAEVLAPLTLILREAGATGVHVLLEDQVVSKKWPRGIAANAEPVTGFLPLNYGPAGGYHYAHELRPYEFHFSDQVFRTWHMQPVLRDVLAIAPALERPLLGSSPAVHGEFTGPVQGQFTGSSPEVDPSYPAAVNYAPDTVDGWYEWTLDNYLPSHPELLQTDERGRGVGVKALAERMATENGKDYDAMKGTASEVAKRLRADVGFAGGTGEVFGIDATGGRKPRD